MKKYLIFVFLGFLFSCNKAYFYQSNAKIENQTWNKSKIIDFKVKIDDINSFYNIGISLNHNKKYEFANLWLFAKIVSPSGKTQTDTLDFILIDKDNKWVGKKRGSNYEEKFEYLDSVKFAEPGDYSFEFEQGMRKDDLPNISSIGLIIDKLQN